MSTWTSRGLRGSVFEDLINRSNEKYRENKLALIQKVPTPITPIKIDEATRHITLAYFDQKSTIDYIGVVQKFPVCFDAKECAGQSFSLANIHTHQIEFMKDFELQGGISFFLIYFKAIEKYFYLSYRQMNIFVERAKMGGRKSFRIDELDSKFFFYSDSGVFVPYLKMITLDLEERNN